MILVKHLLLVVHGTSLHQVYLLLLLLFLLFVEFVFLDAVSLDVVGNGLTEGVQIHLGLISGLQIGNTVVHVF